MLPAAKMVWKDIKIELDFLRNWKESLLNSTRTIYENLDGKFISDEEQLKLMRLIELENEMARRGSSGHLEPGE